MFKDVEGSHSEYSEATVYRIHQGSQVFLKPQYQEYIEHLRKVVNIKEEIFEGLYIRLLHRYAQYVQSLSVPRDNLGGLLLDRSLRRAFGFARYCAPKVIANNGYGFDPDRLMYALFTCALLNGVGRAFQDRSIVICEENGEYVKSYFPTTGFISGAHYKVRAIKSQDEEYVALMNGVYAHNIMLPSGYAWISEDQKLFGWWVASLTDIQKGFSELEIDLDIEKHAKGVGEDLNFEKDVRKHEPVETLEGEAFLAWLKERIAKDSSLINKDGSGLTHVDGALLVELDQFVQAYANEKSGVSAKSVKSQFMMLGIAGAATSYTVARSAGFLGGVTKQQIEACAIEYEKGLFESSQLGPVMQVASNAQVSSGERFFSRIGGLAQQFMLGHTTKK